MVVRPITSVLPVEVLTAEPARPSSRASLHRQRSELRRLQLEAVRMHGGRAAGHTQTPRERCRRMLVSAKWQGFLLATALVDITMLVIEVNVAGSQAAVNAVTALVLCIFVVDLVIRGYTYRAHLCRSGWFWFDLLVVGLSIVLYIVGAALSDVSGGASTPATVARGGKALRGLIVALRWIRSARFAAKLAQTAVSGATSACAALPPPCSP